MNTTGWDPETLDRMIKIYEQHTEQARRNLEILEEKLESLRQLRKQAAE